MIKTAVILARGLGTRMRAEGNEDLTPEQKAAAASGHKALMPLGKYTLIDYSLTVFAQAGIEKIVLVVAPDHQAFKDHFAALKPEKLEIVYAVQEEPIGTANAVASAEAAVGGEPFIMANGDNLYPREGIEALAQQDGNALLGFDKEALIAGSNIPRDRISAFALVKSEDGKFTGLVEKPTAEQIEELGPEAPVSMNLFAFTSEIFDACKRIEKSARGEYEIVDAVALLEEVRVIPVKGGVLDLSRRDDINDVAKALGSAEVSL